MIVKVMMMLIVIDPVMNPSVLRFQAKPHVWQRSSFWDQRRNHAPRPPHSGQRRHTARPTIIRIGGLDEEAGFDEHYTKPLDPDHLEDLLRKAGQRSRSSAPRAVGLPAS